MYPHVNNKKHFFKIKAARLNVEQSMHGINKFSFFVLIYDRHRGGWTGMIKGLDMAHRLLNARV